MRSAVRLYLALKTNETAQPTQKNDATEPLRNHLVANDVIPEPFTEPLFSPSRVCCYLLRRLQKVFEYTLPKDKALSVGADRTFAVLAVLNAADMATKATQADPLGRC